MRPAAGATASGSLHGGAARVSHEQKTLEHHYARGRVAAGYAAGAGAALLPFGESQPTQKSAGTAPLVLPRGLLPSATILTQLKKQGVYKSENEAKKERPPKVIDLKTTHQITGQQYDKGIDNKEKKAKSEDGSGQGKKDEQGLEKSIEQSQHQGHYNGGKKPIEVHAFLQYPSGEKYAETVDNKPKKKVFHDSSTCFVRVSVLLKRRVKMAQNLEMAINGMDLIDVFPQNASRCRAAIFIFLAAGYEGSNFFSCRITARSIWSKSGRFFIWSAIDFCQRLLYGGKCGIGLNKIFKKKRSGGFLFRTAPLPPGQPAAV